jgi:hypothetical protein
MRLRTTLAPALAPASVALLLLLAACGGGGGGDGDGVASLGDAGDDDSTTETTLSEEEAEEAMVDWTQCMRDEGVDLPDFEMDGDGNSRVGSVIIGDSGSGGDEGDEGDGGDLPPMPSPEEFEAAEETCGEPPQLGGEFTEEEREEMQAEALAFAECMREEGIEDFPDPNFSDMGPGAGPSVRIERGGPNDADSDDPDADGEDRQGPFGDIDPSTPEFQTAADACSDKLGDGAPRFRTSGRASSGVGTAQDSE